MKTLTARFISGALLMSVLLACALFPGCSNSSTTNVVPEQVPPVVNLTPSGITSLELGTMQSFTATAVNASGSTLTETFSYQSSNPSIVTVSSGGLACAGVWDSLTAPSLCTPGSTGVAEITAVTANGVSSPPVAVYVHQHITSVVISKVPNQPPTVSPFCLSKRGPSGNPESLTYQAFAYSGTTDITAAVGQFTWQSAAVAGAPGSVSLLSLPTGSTQCIQGPQRQCLNLQIATAISPGTTSIVASVDGVNSQPLPITTCLVESILITPFGSPGQSSFLLNAGSSMTLDATVIDSAGMTITGVPLTWISSFPQSIGASSGTSTSFGSSSSVAAGTPGGAAVTASCTPPTCNSGITPSLPVYSPQAISFVSRSASAPAAPTIYASTTACNTTDQTCTTNVVPITQSTTSGPFTAGTPVALPFSPNSAQYDPLGANAYFGVDSSSFGTRGLMVFTGTSVSALNGVAGRVLAVSPDGNTVILADTVDSPSQVIICATCTSTSHSTTPFLLPGATAAAFSPDNLKAYIVTGGSCPGTSSLGCLLVYSKVDGPQMIQLNAPANDAVFIGEGAVGYIGGSTGSWFLPVCTDTNAAGALGTVGLASEMLRPLPDGQSVLALSPPNLQTVTAKITGPNSPPLNTPGCLAPRGFLSINNTLSSTIDLGEGNFTPTQFLVSSDGSMTYILGEVLPSQRTTVNITAVAQGGTTTNPVTTYAYSLTSGPGLKVGQSIVIGGMNTLGDNGIFNITGLIQGTPGSPCAGSTGTCFAVANSAGVTASGESGTGTVTPRLPFIIAHNLTTQATSLISLVGSSSPLSASLSPSGDLLVVGADDGQVHIIDTNSFMDIDQVLLPFPQSSLCVGPGSPVTKPAITCNPDLVIVKP